MQVSVESTGALERRMTVQVPAERIEGEVESRLQSLARKARIDGFRPGKVPVSVVKRKFGRQVREEVTSEVMNLTLQEALTQENLRPAGEPALESKSSDSGDALEFIATFEIFPEFDPVVPVDILVEKPVVEISDADIQHMLEKLQKQRMSWAKVERAIARDDRVTLDFEGTVEGKTFDGGRGKGVPVEIGAGKLIEGFEEGLIGAAIGEERVLDLKFPDDYRNDAIAGKPVQFKVTVLGIEEPVLPEFDDEFARAFGVEDGGMDMLREEVTKNMQRELDQAVIGAVKDRTFDILLEKNPVDVPGALIDREIDRLQQEISEQAGGSGQTTSLPRDLFKDQATRRVKLGLIIGEVVRRNGIQVDPDRVRRVVESFAATYQNPDEVIRWYYENQTALSSAQSVALEEQVMEWVLDQVPVKGKSMSFEELMQLRQAESA